MQFADLTCRTDLCRTLPPGSSLSEMARRLMNLGRSAIRGRLAVFCAARLAAAVGIDAIGSIAADQHSAERIYPALGCQVAWRGYQQGLG